MAERLAVESGLPVTYVATALACDDEMVVRIAAHKSRRPAGWSLIEEPLGLARVLSEQAGEGRCLLVECLTLWLTNVLTHPDPGRLAVERDALLSHIPSLPGRLILVGNETNMGIIPLGELSRRYCDEAGRLHQELAQLCDGVLFMVAGLPQVLKGSGPAVA